MKSRSIFIGCGFTDDHMLWVLPLAIGYAREKSINHLIFDKKLSSKIYDYLHLQEDLDSFIISFKPSHYRNIINPFFYFFLFKFVVRSFFSLPSLIPSRVNLLHDKHGWFHYQLKHSVWDQAINRSPDGLINPSFISLCKSTVLSLLNLYRATVIIKNDSVTSLFLGHTVYSSRALIAYARKYNVDIIAQGFFSFSRLTTYDDAGWSTLTHKDWISLLSKTPISLSDEYWENRLAGSSKYLDAAEAFKKTQEISVDTPKNILFMHTFRDSPFNTLDRSRIFCDYIEWFTNTLDLMSKSSETWLLKTHPSASKWGENQSKWIEESCKCVFGTDRLPENIIVDNSNYSNIELLSNCRRIVTYRGTVHLEAAAFGVKPIVISNVSLSSFNSDLCLKPSSLEEYKSFILKPSTDSMFQLSATQSQVARQLIYCREKILTFQDDVSGKSLYQGQSKDVHDSAFISTFQQLNRYYGVFITLGSKLALGKLNRIISLKHNSSLVN